MGDFIQAGQNAVVINRSLLTNSMNRVNPDLAESLKAIGAHIEASGNKEAAELFDSFNEELSGPAPKKPVLKALFDGVVKAVPTVQSLIEASSSISELFK